MCQEDLSHVLRNLPKFNDPNLIFGYDTVGDAGVYRLKEDLAIIQTVDILTPIADDPYVFGEIAAANSLSDVYVMGGTPITAMNIVGFPPKLDLSIMEQMIQGGSSKIKEAGAVILGGHTIKDEELKYGMAITAVIDPKDLITNDRAEPGDCIVLTKPLGTGVISTALKNGLASDLAVRKINDSMRQLNKIAAQTMLETGVHACTDVTGFGLLGHAMQLAQASQVSLRIDSKRVPFIEEAFEYSSRSLFPGGTKKNRQFVEPFVQFTPDVTDEHRMLLCDAQTSGGLLIVLSMNLAPKLIELLHQRNIRSAAIIGEVIEAGEKVLYIL